eukprot:TRINITY_DN81092_c0_g1_i1.p1 TRINITY_DN81092_c0_g1~~TRINITY_DN81092_c0_g1_i1.p1  ORF type:complete len:593 (+),score=153.33 TRINITY_DN81092_c0_g1_i1:106-1884(+)
MGQNASCAQKEDEVGEVHGREPHFHDMNVQAALSGRLPLPMEQRVLLPPRGTSLYSQSTEPVAAAMYKGVQGHMPPRRNMSRVMSREPEPFGYGNGEVLPRTPTRHPEDEFEDDSVGAPTAVKSYRINAGGPQSDMDLLGASERSFRLDENAANLRARADNVWQEGEMDKLAFLRQVKAHVSKGGAARQKSLAMETPVGREPPRAIADAPAQWSSPGHRGDRYEDRYDRHDRYDDRHDRDISRRGPERSWQDRSRSPGPGHQRQYDWETTSAAHSNVGSFRSSAEMPWEFGQERLYERFQGTVRARSTAAPPSEDQRNGSAALVTPSSAVKTIVPRNDFGAKDMEAKLKLAQDKVKEAQEKAASENQKRSEVERLLAQTKHGMGGSDLEFQLMNNLVQLRNRVAELESHEGSAQHRVDELKDRLKALGKEKEELRNAHTTLEKTHRAVNDRMEKLDAGQRDLDKFKKTKEKEVERHQKELETVTVERDETLALLQKAVELKEKEKHDRVVQVEKVNREMNKMLDHQRKEQEAFTKVQNLMNTCDGMMQKLHPSQAAESLQALREARHELRVIVQDRARMMKKVEEGRERAES